MASNTFKTKARAIELLGRKQIRDDVTALIELMKNAYDADAERLSVEFFLDTSDPYLIIYDTGHGMTKDDILNKWLVLGTDSKKRGRSQQRLSKDKGRILMGEKGIGRLASAALGEQFWMFTKAQEENWHGLFLNWNIFENTDLFLGDVTIPFVSDQDKESLLSSKSLSNLFTAQFNNLNNSSWLNEDKKPRKKHEELYRRTIAQLQTQTLPIEHLQLILDEIEGDKGQGTVLLIQLLRTRWNDVFSPNNERKADTIAGQRFNRLGSFVDTFSNLTKDFQIGIFSDNQPIEFNHFIDEVLYELYDVKIKGVIEKGKFRGQLFALNADINILNECNKELAQGIDVTYGIKNPGEKDCGSYQVEFCYFEQVEQNSSLTTEQLNELKNRLGTVGGIKVYRDGVRVLPYGDLENDFLNLEERRSRSAGRYLFSHRNMFGKILIDSENNPNLEDKSSREGLLENEEYYYFIATIQNLLYRIAVDFLGGSNKSKKVRLSYLGFNNKRYESAKQASEAILKEKKETELAIKALNEELKEKQASLDRFINLKKEYVFPGPPSSLNYKSISETHENFKKIAESRLYELEQLRKYLNVFINPRYEPSVDDELADKIFRFNERKEHVLLSELDIVSQLIDETQLKFDRQFDEWHRITSNLLKSNFDAFVSRNRERVVSLESRIQNVLSKIDEKIALATNDGQRRLQRLNGTQKTIEEIRNYLREPILQRIQSLRMTLSEAEKIVSSLKQLEPEQMRTQSEHHDNLIRELEGKLIKLEAESAQVVEREAERQVRQSIIIEIEGLMKEIGYVPQDDKIIGELKAKNLELERENEIFVDLANMGMAAEVVNHEFNQLFTNVKDGLENIKTTGLTGTQKYWIQQIESGFKAISARHSQLSPMYRSYNLRKRNIRLYDLVNDMVKFFSGRLSHAQIRVVNQVEPDFELMLSPSKMYPVFSNLIDNAIYWLLDRDEKILLFRSDQSNHSLYIEDSGPGISPRHAKRIFEPFFTQRRGGRGLGLSIVKKVLESQGHNITNVQDVLEKNLTGACFKIKLSDKEQVN